MRVAARLIDNRKSGEGKRRPEPGNIDPVRLSEMRPLLEELAALLELDWDLTTPEVLPITPKTKLFQVRTPGGNYALKLKGYGKKRIKAVTKLLGIVSQMCKEGGIGLPSIKATNTGELIRPYDNRYLTLMEWIEGRPPDLTCADEVGAIMKSLATFHSRSRKFVKRPIPPVSDLVDAVVAEMQERTREAFETGSDHGADDLVRAVSSKGRAVFLAESRRAEAMALTANRCASEDRSVPEISLCHGDSHPMNYMLRDDGRLFMLDLERLKYGLGYEDLVSPLQKFMRRYQWRFDVLRGPLGDYTRIRALPRYELTLLLARLIYPGRVVKGIERVRNKGGPVTKRLRFRLWRERVTHRALLPAKRRFIEAAAHAYDLPGLPDAFDRPSV